MCNWVLNFGNFKGKLRTLSVFPQLDNLKETCEEMTIFIVQFLYIFQLSWVEHAGLMKLVTQLSILLNASKKHVHVHSHSSAVTVVGNIFISRLLKETIWLARSTNFIYVLV